MSLLTTTLCVWMLPEIAALHILSKEDTAGLHTTPDTNVSRMSGECAGDEGEPCWTCTDKWNAVLDNCERDQKGGLSWQEAVSCGAPPKWEPLFMEIAAGDHVVEQGEFD